MAKKFYFNKRKSAPVQMNSGLEVRVAEDLHERGVKFTYESESFNWVEELPRAFCGTCGTKRCFVHRSYTPDLFLSSGIILEIKGNFTSHDRKIAAAMKTQHPELDIRMVFQRDNWLTRRRKTKYSDWCDSKGIKYCVGKVPEEWL